MDHRQVLNDDEFLDALAKRMIRIISSGKSEGNETIQQVGEHQFTRHQLERLKKAFLFLCSNDKEIQTVIKRIFKKEIVAPIRDPLNKSQMARRIQEYGALAFKHKGRLCGFWVDEIYSIFGEYSRIEVKNMMKNNGLWIKDIIKKHPKTLKYNRAIILDI